MFASITAAKASFEMVFFCKDHQSLLIDIIVFLGQFWHWLLFLFHGLAKSQLVYLSLICSENRVKVTKT